MVLRLQLSEPTISYQVQDAEPQEDGQPGQYVFISDTLQDS